MCDGRLLVLGAAPAVVSEVNPGTGGVSVVQSARSDVADNMAFGPDGRLYNVPTADIRAAAHYQGTSGVRTDGTFGPMASGECTTPPGADEEICEWLAVPWPDGPANFGTQQYELIEE